MNFFIDPTFSRGVIKQLQELECPEELIKLVESQYVRYGDHIKLLTRSHYARNKTKNNRRASLLENSEAYVGIYEKPDGN